MSRKTRNDREHSRSRGADRRSFLKASAATLGAAALVGRLPAEVRAGKEKRRRRMNPVLVTLFLRGGADALSLVAPTGDTVHYPALRGSAAIPPPGSGLPGEGLAMDATFSMHPLLAGLHAGYAATGSTFAVIHAVGAVPYDRSHFESQDLFETGGLTGQFSDGWINRHLVATASPSDPPVRALALRSSLPRILAGGYPTYAVKSIADLSFLATQPDIRSTLEPIVDLTPTGGMPTARQTMYQSMSDTFDLIDHFAGIDPSAYVPANGATYPQTPLGEQLAETAQLIKANLGLEFIHVDMGGWDHHNDLVNELSTYVPMLDQALSAFLQDMGALMSDVVVLVMSEFGREAALNGSQGADHGVGGVMFAIGGAVQGGQVHGAWPGLAPGALEAGRFLAPANDFRDVCLEILEDHMGGTLPASVFPGHAYSPLGLI